MPEAEANEAAHAHVGATPHHFRLHAAMVISGGAIVSKQVLIARYAGSVTNKDLFGDLRVCGAGKVSEIKGPLNILLVGIDPRDANTRPCPTRSSWRTFPGT